MAKLRLTKNEIRKQKNALKRYTQYLPTLILKKQQLQTEIQKTYLAIEEFKKKEKHCADEVNEWVDVFAENIGMGEILKLKEIVTVNGNIAGVDIPIFEKVRFEEKEYDLVETPFWVDSGVEMVKKILILHARIEVLQKQAFLIGEELRITTQRVNLFEKVMIPKAKDNIRKIGIYLGDMQTAAVVTGKIAKEKLLRRGANI